MAIYKKDFQKRIESSFGILRKNILKENKRLSKIVSGDDWSFMIKSLAVLESTISKLLISKSNDIRFEKFYSRISLSQKVDLLVDLELISKQQRKFIFFLSKIRNNLAHNPEEIHFNLKKYIKSLSLNDLKQLPNIISISDENKLDLKFIESNPKNALWITLMSLIAILITEIEMSETKKELNKLALETSEKILKEIAPNMFISKK